MLRRQRIDITKVKNPEKNPIEIKPLELNLYQNGPRTRTPAQNVPAQPPLPSMPFMYNYYPSPYPTAPGWYPQPPPHAPNLMPAPNQALPVHQGPPAPKVEYPKIADWLKYCDLHPDRRGEDFSVHQLKFDQEGYRRINQLVGNRMTVEKLSEWLGIGKGTADLLIQYAEEDMELVRGGTFSMVLADVEDFGGFGNH